MKKQPTQTSHDQLQAELKQQTTWFLLGYSCLILLVSVSLLVFHHSFQRRLANIYIRSVQHSLVIADYRQVLTSLGPSLRDGFLGVEVQRLSDQFEMHLPSDDQFALIQKNWFAYPVSVHLEAGSIPTPSQKSPELKIRFYYSVLTPVIWLGLISLLLIAFSFFLFRRNRTRVLERHHWILRQKESEAVEAMAKQVSHDIRSPLSALNMILGHLNTLPEDHRILIRSAVQRIHDIANDLLGKKSTNTEVDKADTEALSVELIAAIVDGVVSEKRMQFRSSSSVEISVEIAEGYGSFAAIPIAHFKRALSNLINNAVEALEQRQGTVRVVVRKTAGTVRVEVCDTGKGIPADVLPKLGAKGYSQGKDSLESGSGLGLFHAKQMVESLGGQFGIESTVGSGTRILLIFKQAPSPEWFVDRLRITVPSTVVTMDDDSSVHAIWKERWKEFGEAPAVKHIEFRYAQDLIRWAQAHTAEIYLVDFELLNQDTNGLALIEQLGLQSQAILVTSRYEEPAIQEKCKNLGIRMIPKSMAACVPIEWRE